MGRSRGGLTTKIHAVVDAKGLPIRLGLTPGQTVVVLVTKTDQLDPLEDPRRIVLVDPSAARHSVLASW